MSVYIEVELRCDGTPGDRFGCADIIFATTGRRARMNAKERGWRISAPGGKDYCPAHKDAAS